MTKLPSNHIVICMSIIYSVYSPFQILNLRGLMPEGKGKGKGKDV